jgi:GH25 family lysozyme M1 (1,4-beta-N-acetylmuramidase)
VAIGFADLSHYQAGVDLGAYARVGYDRVFLKATQGDDGVDPTFGARWREAGELGLARCAYHFAEAEDDGAADFDHFIAVVNAAGGLGPADLLCLDSEDSPNIGRADEHAREFTNRAAARGHPNGCLYTGRWFADPANLRPDDLAPGWRRLWISYYGTAADDAIPLPAGWTRDQVIARQYTDRATVAGVSGLCDANRVLKEWITMTLTSGDAKLIATELAGNTAFLLAVRGQVIAVLADKTHSYLTDELQPLKDAIALAAAGQDAVLAKLERFAPAGGLAEDDAATAARVAPHLRLTAGS